LLLLLLSYDLGTTLTSDLENLFSNAPSSDEYLCHVSLKSLQQVKRYHITSNRC